MEKRRMNDEKFTASLAAPKAQERLIIYTGVRAIGFLSVYCKNKL